MPTYPYVSGQQPVAQTFAQLRKGGFPAKVDAGYLKRFNIASSNESYVISILRFLDLIDEEGNRRDENADFFYGSDDVFNTGLERTMRSAYARLFDEMGDGALTAPKVELASWFRGSDKTSELVGQRQASTFLTLAALAGHGAVPTARSSTPMKKTAAASATPAKKAATKTTTPPTETPPKETPGGADRQKHSSDQGVGLTVRIEVNLPPGGDAGTYDAIFASIKKHLMS